MPLNRAHIGRTWTQTHAVDPARARAFAEVTGADALLACSLGLGAWTAPLLDPELSCELMRLRLESYAIELRGPVPAGGRVEAECTLVAVEDTEWGERMRLSLEVSAEGAPISRATSALRFRKAPPGQRTRALLDEEAAEEAEVVAAFTALPARFAGARAVSLAQCARFAEALGDPNPVRFDPEAARMAGLPAPVAHELLVLSLVHGVVAEALAPSRVRSLGVRFSKPLLPGGSLSVEARGETSLTLLARDDAGEVVVHSGTVEVEP